MSIHDGRSILLFSSGASLALVWAELRSFSGRVVSYFALLRRFSNPSHFADRCFEVLCHLMNAAHCTWKDLHSLQIHAANIEWITSEPFIVCWVPPQFSCSSGPAQHSTAQDRNLVAAQEAPDPPVLPPAAFLFTKFLFTKLFRVGHNVYLQYSNAVYTATWDKSYPNVSEGLVLVGSTSTQLLKGIFFEPNQSKMSFIRHKLVQWFAGF